LACEAQAMVAHPLDEKFKQMGSHESLRNCNVKVDDITNARTFFGPNHSRLKGGQLGRILRGLILSTHGSPKIFLSCTILLL
jgi:hypothetical protein